LLHMGKEYPKGYEYFRNKAKSIFLKNKDVTDETEIEKLLHRGQFVLKELETLYMLRKYRTLKKRYNPDE
ncbi:hypothetical protein HELRODRAFT_79641, partial [Helobdella robusta]|uniref:Complex 1 LYR protein domain-containing protein n=1 Tax=Helobdella robusta TaxID=6412 RepID=T1G3R7_HELRO